MTSIYRTTAFGPATSPRTRWYDAFRNEAGAFDLPSILVGVVVVGILTAGVLASIFGVIPFAQDKGAQQDLDGLRTAEGVAKAKDSTFKTSADLATAGYLPGTAHLAADTDASGSCYAAVARSESGRLYVSTSKAPAADELLPESAPGCITPAELAALASSVGGTWTAPTAPAGVAFTPVVGSNGVSAAVITYMNAQLERTASADMSEVIRLLPQGGLGAAMASPAGQAVEAKRAAYEAAMSQAELDEYNVLIDRNDDLRQANIAENMKMMFDPAHVDQQRMVDTMYAWFQDAVDTPLG